MIVKYKLMVIRYIGELVRDETSNWGKFYVRLVNINRINGNDSGEQNYSGKRYFTLVRHKKVQ